MKTKITIEIIAFLFILLFVYAAITKLADLQKFQAQMGQSPLLGNMAGLISFFIPGSELFLSTLLAIPKFRLIGFYGSFTSMVMFTAYIVIIINYADHVPCSCGGVLEQLGWTEHLILNVFFILLSLLGILLLSKEQHRLSEHADRCQSIVNH